MKIIKIKKDQYSEDIELASTELNNMIRKLEDKNDNKSFIRVRGFRLICKKCKRERKKKVKNNH